ncbi:hypothetical protein GXP67_12520 [Rhodocytophaga rosea]|uniref:Uncharacterized protein n=1 Tax=Rhodocytophaga rosea TaxID=2704465 RepID=A0A6C0GHC3_9BACT|nr:hypothetical protein [Rhodocytophaga rosea]QHT67398.1 hypothetical protein GXP67_12520 [Rhodocytophaga rosea]
MYIIKYVEHSDYDKEGSYLYENLKVNYLYKLIAILVSVYSHYKEYDIEDIDLAMYKIIYLENRNKDKHSITINGCMFPECIVDSPIELINFLKSKIDEHLLLVGIRKSRTPWSFEEDIIEDFLEHDLVSKLFDCFYT